MDNYQEQRSFLGRLMYNFVCKSANVLMKHMWLYYLLSYTWGILTTLVGWIVIGFARLFLSKKIVEAGRFGPSIYLMLGHNWGGLEMGTNFFVAGGMSPSWTLHTKQHELGHTFQNAILGPFAIFLSFIPSVIRYWYQENRSRKHKENKPYDLAWFEGSASDIGKKYYEEAYSFTERVFLK